MWLALPACASALLLAGDQPDVPGGRRRSRSSGSSRSPSTCSRSSCRSRATAGTRGLVRAGADARADRADVRRGHGRPGRHPLRRAGLLRRPVRLLPVLPRRAGGPPAGRRAT
jgi:hypothetical protein